jgi:hypothetical protein
VTIGQTQPDAGIGIDQKRPDRTVGVGHIVTKFELRVMAGINTMEGIERPHINTIRVVVEAIKVREDGARETHYHSTT